MSQSPSASTLRIPLPAVLKENDNINHWRIKVDAYLTGQDEKTKRGIILQLLNEPAMDWWVHQVNNQAIDEETPVKTILDGLINFFTPISTIAHAEQELASITQNGSVQDYLKKFVQVTTRIPDITEGERRRTFVRGLKPHIRRELYKQGTINFAQAQQIALVFDSSMRTFFPPVRHTPTMPSAQPTLRRIPHDDPMDCSAFGVKIKKLSDKERSHLISIGGCFACRKPGHHARNCPSFNKSQKVQEMCIPEDEQEMYFQEDQ
jgi:hypothetical protein